MKSSISEAAFQSQVIQFAKLHGWRVAHFRPAMNRRGQWMTAVSADGAGFPDLIMVKGGTVIAAELKVGKNKLSVEQQEWLFAFAGAGVECRVWRETDWPEIESMLSRK